MDKKFVVPALMAAGAVAAAIGFGSPSTRMTKLENKIEKVESRVNTHDVRFAEVKKDLEHIAKGVDELLRHNRRSSRRSDRGGEVDP